MIDIVSGDLAKGHDWAETWNASPNAAARIKELEELKSANSGRTVENEDDKYEYASTNWMQLRLVTKRATIQVSMEEEGRADG